MYSVNDINKLLQDYLGSKKGQTFLKENGVSANLYTDADLVQIAHDIKSNIINTFLGMTKHASLVDARDYFNSSHVKVSKAKAFKNGNRVNIIFSDYSLFRPSLVRRNGQSSSGIHDIFALITNGTSYKGNVYGYWTYSKNKSYGAKDRWTKGSLPRAPKPFISNIIKQYETQYPGLEISYPLEWK